MNVLIRFCATVVVALAGAGCGSNQRISNRAPYLIESMKTHCADGFSSTSGEFPTHPFRPWASETRRSILVTAPFQHGWYVVADRSRRESSRPALRSGWKSSPAQPTMPPMAPCSGRNRATLDPPAPLCEQRDQRCEGA